MAESDLREAARRLGIALRETEEVTRYLDEKRVLDADDEAARLIEKQASLQKAVGTRQKDQSISIAELQELKELQDAVASKVSAYLAAQQEAKRLLTIVNDEISRRCGFGFSSLARPADCCA